MPRSQAQCRGTVRVPEEGGKFVTAGVIYNKPCDLLLVVAAVHESATTPIFLLLLDVDTDRELEAAPVLLSLGPVSPNGEGGTILFPPWGCSREIVEAFPFDVGCAFAASTAPGRLVRPDLQELLRVTARVRV
jgi:hypothetical protein